MLTERSKLTWAETDFFTQDPVAQVIKTIPNLPGEASTRLRIQVLAKTLANRDISREEHAKILDNKLKASNGNWIELIKSSKAVGRIYPHQVQLYLYEAIYHLFMSITKEPVFAFRSTMELAGDIDKFSEEFSNKANGRPNHVTYTNEFHLYRVAKQLAETGDNYGSVHFIEPSKPSVVLS